MKITVLVGLPGSGKSYLANQLIEDREDVIFLDDISILGIDELKKTIEVHGWADIIISDVFLCREKERSIAERWFKKNASNYEVEWIYFENAANKCYANVQRRNANGDCRKVGELIRDLAKEYVIPEGVEVKAVFG